MYRRTSHIISSFNLIFFKFIQSFTNIYTTSMTVSYKNKIWNHMKLILQTREVEKRHNSRGNSENMCDMNWFGSSSQGMQLSVCSWLKTGPSLSRKVLSYQLDNIQKDAHGAMNEGGVISLSIQINQMNPVHGMTQHSQKAEWGRLFKKKKWRGRQVAPVRQWGRGERNKT